MKLRKRPRVPWWWLSYADEHAPQGDGFRGVVLVRARNMEEAVLIAHRLKLSPGGQVLGIEILESEGHPPEEFRNRLLSRDDVVRWQGEAKSIGDLEREMGRRKT